MTYISKPVVRYSQFVEWLYATFPDWTKDEANDVLEFLLNYDNYVEIYFINNDEDLSLVDEGEREIFANVNRVYTELRNIFYDTDYVSILVCWDW